MTTDHVAVFDEPIAARHPRSRVVTRRRAAVAGLLAVLTLSLTASPAFATTRIRFPRGSFCGTYVGNFRRGREFVLGLRDGQRLTVRNIGIGRQTTTDVEGPTGTLEAVRDSDSQLSYYTEADGDHYIVVRSTTARASIEFCAF